MEFSDGFWIYCSSACRASGTGGHKGPTGMRVAGTQVESDLLAGDGQGADACRRCESLDAVLEDLRGRINELTKMNVNLRGGIDRLERSNDELANSLEQLEVEKLTRQLLFIPDPQTGTVKESPERLRGSDKGRVLILCDEFGRHVNRSLLDLPKCKDYKIETIIKPGACFGGLMEDVTRLLGCFTSSDHVVIVGGANDFVDNNSPFIGDVLARIKQCLHTNVMVASVPVVPANKHNRRFISRFNKKLENFILKVNNFMECSASFLNISDKKGRKLDSLGIAVRIADILRSPGTSKNLIFVKTNQDNTVGTSHEKVLDCVSNDGEVDIFVARLERLLGRKMHGNTKCSTGVGHKPFRVSS